MRIAFVVFGLGDPVHAEQAVVLAESGERKRAHVSGIGEEEFQVVSNASH